jgi:hypothetical protein
VFDCFNEVISAIWKGESAIDYVKMIMFGKHPQIRYLSSKEELEILLILAKEQALEHSLMLCGMIKDKDDSVMASFGNIDGAVLNHIREQRLNRMLNQHVDSRYADRRHRARLGGLQQGDPHHAGRLLRQDLRASGRRVHCRALGHPGGHPEDRLQVNFW